MHRARRLGPRPAARLTGRLAADARMGHWAPMGTRLAFGTAPGRARAGRPAAWALVGLAVANGVAVVGLWVSSGGPRDIQDTASLLAGIGRVAGLLGAYLALVQVLLLARLPVLERLAGFDRLTTWHRRNGVACLALLLAHAALITAGYTLGDGLSLPDEVARLISGYPGVITAIGGARAARRGDGELDRHRAAAAALRDLVLRPPLRLPGDRARVQPPARRRAATSSVARAPAPTGTRSTAPRWRRSWATGSACRSCAACATGCG